MLLRGEGDGSIFCWGGGRGRMFSGFLTTLILAA